ncbi:MAG: HDIG domain-containing metalloprotein [Bacteroidales bacterium]|nr:HDIG domain-containing protein [Bacteroidales bacterium]
MFKKNSYKKYWFIVNISLVVILLTFLMPNKGKFKYDYQRGRPWLYETLIAPVDFPVIKTNSELREARSQIASTMVPYYKSRPYLEHLNYLNEQFKQTISDSTIVSTLEEYLIGVYKKGVLDEFPDTLYSSDVIAIKSDINTTYLSLKNVSSSKEVYNNIFKIIDTISVKDKEVVQKLFPSGRVSPSLIYDDTSTQQVFKDAIANISPTKGIVYSGQLIVSKGEIITAETEQLLDSFKAEYDVSMGFSGNIYLLKLGHFFLVLTIVLLLIVTIYYLRRDLLRNFAKLNFILLLLVVVVLSSILVVDYGSNFLYILPFSVIALYLSSFFRSKIVVPLYMIILLPIIFTTSGGFELYFINIVAGAVAFYTFQFWDRGWSQFINSLFIFFALSLTYTSFRLLEEGTLLSLEGSYFLYFAWNSLLVVAAYPFLFLFEKVFGLVSNSRLRDLSDATSSLLNTLAEKAPGTFHHSLQVANLAESAANIIGANALLTRVGALYHDIGKLSNPPYFIENLPAGEVNLHKELSPEESASIIINHVDEGVAIAKKMRLPQIVTDFILTHHGKTQTLYFYNQYVNSGGDSSNIDKFTYNGNLPVTKEQVIVMMADAVEAASRTLKDYSSESISALVEKMIEERISEDQLVESYISIREINLIKEVFKLKLSQTYHGRVAYPERK